VIAACALTSITAARMVVALRGAGEIGPALTATAVGGLAAGAMLAADLYPARELGLALAVGLVLDLALVRFAVLGLAGRWIR
jgi:hypothetical protein